MRVGTGWCEQEGVLAAAVLVSAFWLRRRQPAIRCTLGGPFTDQEKDDFLEQAFEFIASFFEGSLAELEERTRGISTKFRRIEANHFTAAIYHNGAAKSQCKIWLAARDRFTGNIHYSSDPSTRDNSYNESMNPPVRPSMNQ